MLSEHSDKYRRTVQEGLNLILERLPEAKERSWIEALEAACSQYATKKEQAIRVYTEWLVDRLLKSSPDEKVRGLREIVSIATDPHNRDPELDKHLARLVAKLHHSAETERELNDYLEVLENEREAIDRWVEGGYQHLELAIGLNPLNGQAHYIRGLAKAKRGHWSDAIADYDEAARLFSWKNHSLYADRGFAQAQLGRLDEARKDYAEAIHAVLATVALQSCSISNPLTRLGVYPK